MRKTYKKKKGGGGFFSKAKKITVVNEKRVPATTIENPMLLKENNKKSIDQTEEYIETNNKKIKELKNKILDLEKLKTNDKEHNENIKRQQFSEIKKIKFIEYLNKQVENSKNILEKINKLKKEKMKGGEKMKEGESNFSFNNPLLQKDTHKLKRRNGSRKLIKMSNQEIENRDKLFEHNDPELGKSNSYSSEIKRLEDEKEILTTGIELLEEINKKIKELRRPNINSKLNDRNQFVKNMNKFENNIKENKEQLHDMEEKIEYLKDAKKKGINYRYKNRNDMSNAEIENRIDTIIKDN